MLYRWLADLVVVLHFLFVAFVAIGAILCLKWRWLVWMHVPVVVWAAAIVTIGFTCPLTPLEKFLRRRAGETAYEGGFIDHHIRDVVYPGERTVQARMIVALTIVAGYMVMLSRHRRRASIATGSPGGHTGDDPAHSSQ